MLPRIDLGRDRLAIDHQIDLLHGL
jgi:hypothetical protein